MRDATIIAGLVNQLLGEHGSDMTDEPATLTATTTIDSQNLLESLRVIDISLFDSSGGTIWSTSANLTRTRTVPDHALEAARNSSVSSNLTQLTVTTAEGDTNVVDVVETYLPLLDSDGANPVGVIGVTRDVSRQRLHPRSPKPEHHSRRSLCSVS